MKHLTEDAQNLMSDALSSFFSKLTTDGIICFDTETNGVNPSNSVLSVSAIALTLDTSSNTVYELERFNRFYYAEEPETPQAIAVNGLTDDKISELRKGVRYPKLFKDDPAFKDFCTGFTAFIGHNLSFDLQFTPFIKNPIVFDTMMTNTNIVKCSYNEYRKQWKWPKLNETAKFYGIELQESRLHESIYDVEVTVQIFKEMMKYGEYRIPKLVETVPF